MSKDTSKASPIADVVSLVQPSRGQRARGHLSRLSQHLPKDRTQEDHMQNQKLGVAPWGAWAAVILAVLVFLLAQVAGAYLLDIYPHIRGFSPGQTTDWFNSVYGQFFFVLITETFTVGFLWLFIRRYRGRGVRAAMGLARRAEWEDIVYAFIGVVAYFGLYLAALSVVTSVVHVNVNQQQDIGFQGITGHQALILTFISLVILPPIVEELVFRGFLYSGLRKHLGIIGGALLTSALFALPHLMESDSGGPLWVAGIDTFTLSLVLCYLRERTGAIYAGMGVHALKNTIAFISLYIVHMR